MTVDAGFASWLKSDALYAVAANADTTMRYGDKARASTITSPLAFAPDAQAEAVRQLAFLGGPLALDEHVVIGRRSDLVGRLVRLRGDRFGYDAAPLVFVLSASEQSDGTTTLTVLKRL